MGKAFLPRIAPILVLADMEMRAHHPSKRGSMEEDRLSNLPDDLLHSILRVLSLKHAARTSALSRRWVLQWLRAVASSNVVDLTDRDFARGQPPARAASTVRRCLELHAEHGAPLDVFRAALRSPPAADGSSDDGAFGRDVVGWIASAVARGAREVEVDLTPTPALPTLRHSRAGARSFRTPTHSRNDGSAAAFVELPGDLFAARNSLARLALGGFSLHAVPAAPTGLDGLRSLSLSHADVTGEEVGGVVSSCRALEHLSLSSCSLLKSIRIASETLRVLHIARCRAVRELRVAAPALESLALHGDTFFYWYADVDDSLSSPIGDLGSMPALRDIYLSQIRFGHLGTEFGDMSRCGCQDHEYDYAGLLRRVAHAPVWTLSCDGWLESGNIWDLSELDMTNLQELQLLITTFGDCHEHLSGFACFFENNQLPLLDRLFLRFPAGHVTDESDADAAEALASEVVDDAEELEIEREFALDSLSFIKLVNFRGTMFELQLLAFVLKRAPALDHLVLVTVGEDGGGAPGPGDEHLEVIQRRVSAIQKKASPHARLTVRRPSQDRSQNPVHTRLYQEDDSDLEADTEENGWA